MPKNIYGKLQDIRVALQGRDIKKSGYNKFAGYSYYELGDYLPTINELMQEHRVTTVTKFTSDIASMNVIDIDTGDSVEFTSPMGSANLKGCHEVQNIGAVETYQRRYLYQVAFEIVEHDALDGTLDPKSQPDKKATQQDKKPATKTDGDPELLGIGEQMKSALAALAEKADPAIVEGYKTDGVRLYRKEDKKGLRELVKKVENWKPAAEGAEAAQRVFTDDLPEDVY